MEFHVFSCRFSKQFTRFSLIFTNILFNGDHVVTRKSLLWRQNVCRFGDLRTTETLFILKFVSDTIKSSLKFHNNWPQNCPVLPLKLSQIRSKVHPNCIIIDLKLSSVPCESEIGHDCIGCCFHYFYENYDFFTNICSVLPINRAFSLFFITFWKTWNRTEQTTQVHIFFMKTSPQTFINQNRFYFWTF